MQTLLLENTQLTNHRPNRMKLLGTCRNRDRLSSLLDRTSSRLSLDPAHLVIHSSRWIDANRSNLRFHSTRLLKLKNWQRKGYMSLWEETYFSFGCQTGWTRQDSHAGIKVGIIKCTFPTSFSSVSFWLERRILTPSNFTYFTPSLT